MSSVLSLETKSVDVLVAVSSGLLLDPNPKIPMVTLLLCVYENEKGKSNNRV